MLDVHPPHTPTHTWRDFLLHIATIVVGLLIAVGLEQLVEVLHHRHQRHELVESLLEDTKRTLRDTQEYDRVVELQAQWTGQRIAEVRTALHGNQTLVVASRFPWEFPSTPDSPSWTAAKASGLLAVSSQDEVRSLGEAAGLATAFMPFAADDTAQVDKTQRFEQHYIVTTTPLRYDYSVATPAELGQYLDQLLTLQTALHRADIWLRYIRGADVAVVEGSRNIDEVENSELRFIPHTAPQ